MYDLLIKGGRVIDPAQDIDDNLDVAISGDKIAAVTEDIAAEEARQVYDAKNKIVTPGLIDMHCHVYDSVKIGVDPDTAGVQQGVTTVADAGSAGEATFRGFVKYVIPSARTTIFSFLHLSSQGLIILPELKNWEEIDPDATAATIEAHRDIIKGIKIRMVGNLAISDGVEVVKAAKKTAKNFGLPIMVHAGDRDKKVPPTLIREYLPLMEQGDILSHVFTGNPGGTMSPDGTVLPELLEARDRGVILDVANGKANLNYEVARKEMAQGIIPDTLTSDLIAATLNGPVYGLTVTMSRFMALGLQLGQVIEMTTINPARALSIADRKGSLKPGMDADVSILEFQDGVWKLEDAQQEMLEVTRMFSPVSTVKSGQLLPAQPAARPQPLS
ncbi:amidohydrolase/deacetylase family metallohydrolase [Chloroflexota bacterium]